jgi:hypothetical protein
MTKSKKGGLLPPFFVAEWKLPSRGNLLIGSRCDYPMPR